MNHHIAGVTKLIILIAACYPFINVAFRYAVLNDPYARGSTVTLGDVLVVCAQVLVGMYMFELIYRTRIRYVVVLRTHTEKGHVEFPLPCLVISAPCITLEPF